MLLLFLRIATAKSSCDFTTSASVGAYSQD